MSEDPDRSEQSTADALHVAVMGDNRYAVPHFRQTYEDVGRVATLFRNVHALLKEPASAARTARMRAELDRYRREEA